MFRPDIALAVESSGNTLTNTTECAERAYRAEHRLYQLKEIRTKKFETKGKSSESTGRSKIHRVSSLRDKSATREKETLVELGALSLTFKESR